MSVSFFFSRVSFSGVIELLSENDFYIIAAVTGVPERIYSIIQARPGLLRSQALLNFLVQLNAGYHLGPGDITVMDTE